MSKTFEQWLMWMESCHPVEIELGLERCNQVLSRLISKNLPFPIITVAGTNGKGSTVAVLEALALQAGCKPLVFTSPHFIDYRERIRFNGDILSEQQHVDVFEQLEVARQDEPLTYFEFSTLSCFKFAELLEPDLLILETGLGGRLDAVNVVAADIAIITTVDFDHQDWLGDKLEDIAREKAGIIHQDKIAIIADPEFPEIIIDEVRERTDNLYLANQDFYHQDNGQRWSWANKGCAKWEFDYLSFPYANVSAALKAWSLLDDFCELSQGFVRKALSNIKLVGRFEIIATSPMIILDVAHNPQAFRVQSKLLAQQGCSGKTHLVLGMLQDKNISDSMEILNQNADRWYLADLETSRGVSANTLKQQLNYSEFDKNKLQCYPSPVEAYNAAYNNASKDDRILVTGSFYTVSPVLELQQKDLD
ncbi:MAG: bifunctional folylpolyglutamate synthase/dihydrofolate synthase [Gammaproteobacteria bacterium]|nr:MAG: bifunctional folylpolyglutamate synthase/dihydrofolate synthase [Gammaproteobacteria bacterium]